MVHRNISHGEAEKAQTEKALGEAKKAQIEKALGEAKKAQTEKADKSDFWAFIQHKNKES